MSWKAVELQVALPRVVDAAQMQEQLSQRGQNVQNHLVQARHSEEQIKRSQVQKADTFNRISDQGNGPTPNSEQRHPYLGQSVDQRG
ncbi:hypothetical protein ACTWQB_06680 [Piscibacillus sp. B03]|uniref:hypothetical protein n=1 Tax=Piscibacillus sp. B03 TaxID=3457430 RepID=UPI003FCD7A36